MPLIMASPVLFLPSPWMTFKAPAGSPASSKSLAKRYDVVGVSSEGFQTTVLPQRSAGIIFQLGTAIGKFPALIIPTTPYGRRYVMHSLSRISDQTVWP